MLSQGPFAFGRPVIRGVIRQSPADFEVEEDLGFEPGVDEAGEHLWLWVEKQGQNTAWVASELAKAAGVHPRRVGFAGLKDRHARTRQWLSIHLPGQPTPDWQQWSIEGVSVLKGRRAAQKIARGRLAGNHFRLTLRALQPIEPGAGVDVRQALEVRLEAIRHRGVPNCFGEQRFGGNNLGRARRLFAGELRGQRSKPKRGFYLSAARSFLFNAVLAQRITDETWDQWLEGDVANLSGSQSCFALAPGQADDPELNARLAQMDLHPTGPLPGVGEALVSGATAALEAACLAPHADLVSGLEQFKVKAMRRPLRSVVHGLTTEWLDDETLVLDFGLGQGAFATAVLRELIAYEA